MKPTIEGIWNEFAARLRQFIRGRVADEATAEDILQDIFLKLQARVDELQEPAKVQGWLFLVARNAIIDHYRTRKQASAVPESLPAELPENVTEMEELRAVFRRLVDSLPEPYRQALVLTEFEGLTQEALAKRLGISLSGAKSRVQRGREQLKDLLLDYCHREFSRTAGVQPCPSGLLPVAGETKPARKRRGAPRSSK